MRQQSVYVGIDVGSSRTKAAIIDHNKNLIGRSVRKSGTDFTATSERCLDIALDMAGCGRDAIAAAVSTGYGRKNVPVAQDTKTEIGCHAKGCYHYFPEAITIIDIGGQDNKVIKLDKTGHRTSFKMNRKCAAGTGAFLEEMSPRLDIPLEEMESLTERLRERLQGHGIHTVQDLLALNAKELSTIPGIGPVTAQKLLDTATETLEENLAEAAASAVGEE